MTMPFPCSQHYPTDTRLREPHERIIRYPQMEFEEPMQISAVPQAQTYNPTVNVSHKNPDETHPPRNKAHATQSKLFSRSRYAYNKPRLRC
ncbi:hypothetical protein RSAG8_13990, partial [Rhizoctonia solani AG-8 WAC10335]